MGLFSPRNLITPFTNTVNLIAIIFIILLFAVFRFSSGRYQVEPLKTKPLAQVQTAVPTSPSSLDNLESILDKKKDGQAAAENEKAASAGRDSLDLKAEINALEKGGGSDKQKEEDKGKNDSGLKDVEKALGLR